MNNPLLLIDGLSLLLCSFFANLQKEYKFPETETESKRR